MALSAKECKFLKVEETSLSCVYIGTYRGVLRTPMPFHAMLPYTSTKMYTLQMLGIMPFCIFSRSIFNNHLRNSRHRWLSHAILQLGFSPLLPILRVRRRATRRGIPIL